MINPAIRRLHMLKKAHAKTYRAKIIKKKRNEENTSVDIHYEQWSSSVISSDYKDIPRTAQINVPKETKIGCRSSLASQRIQKCARIRVNECEYTKNWKNVFADVCIFFF